MRHTNKKNINITRGFCNKLHQYLSRAYLNISAHATRGQTLKQTNINTKIDLTKNKKTTITSFGSFVFDLFFLISHVAVFCTENIAE